MEYERNDDRNKTLSNNILMKWNHTSKIPQAILKCLIHRKFNYQQQLTMFHLKILMNSVKSFQIEIT